MVDTPALAIDGVAAQARQAPGTSGELAELLAIHNVRGHAVAPVGGGTQLDLGMPPSRLDFLLETTRLNRLVEYEPADLTVTVEAGMRLIDLQRTLAEQGQVLALDPPLEDGATIGGVIATNASGALRFAYGSARDLVIGTRVANPDGTVTHAGGRVVKNVAGYDLNKLYVGSLGTLAIIVELSFKLAPIPPVLATIGGELSDAAAARALVGAVLRSALAPLAIELIGSRQVVFRVGGYPQAVERQVGDLSALIAEHGGRSVDTDWSQLMRDRVLARRRDVVLKATAPISTSARLVDILERNLREFEPTVWAHAGNGVAYAACNAPSDATALHQTRRDVLALGTNSALVVERCPTVLKRSIDVWGEPGPSLAIMRAIKSKLDPNSTLNPGRYVGGL